MSSVPTSKDELENAINTIFVKLMADYQSIPNDHSRTIGVKGNIKGTEISVCDTVAYLIGWGQLVLKWYKLFENGKQIDFPETGYKWNHLGLLAEHFHNQYEDWKYFDLLYELENTVIQLLALIAHLDDETLYGSPWYENYTLGRMIQFNTSSPMKNMRTKVRYFKRQYQIK